MIASLVVYIGKKKPRGNNAIAEKLNYQDTKCQRKTIYQNIRISFEKEKMNEEIKKNKDVKR